MWGKYALYSHTCNDEESKGKNCQPPKKKEQRKQKEDRKKYDEDKRC